MTSSNLILVLGILGQVFFTGRVFLQWMASEKAKDSVVPFSYWVMSIFGSLLLLVYAVFRKDPVFSVGQAFGLAVYCRNIHFMRRKKSNAE